MISPPEIPASPALPPSRARSRELYRVVWRWHFYAGLMVAPFLLVMAVTGSLLTYAPELRVMSYPDRYVSRESSPTNPMTLDEQARTARAALPDAGIESVLIEGPGRTTLFTMKRGESPPITVAVDPGDGSRAEAFKLKEDWLGFVENLHRRLLLGGTGRVVTELVAGWAMVMAITGVFLWWPRGKSWREGVLGIRFRQGAYLALRDAHAVVGALAAAFVVAQAFSGLTMSRVEGGLIKAYILRVPPRAAPMENRGGGGAKKHEPRDEGAALAWETARLVAATEGLESDPFILRRAAGGAITVTARPRFGVGPARGIEINSAGEVARRFTDPRTPPKFSRVAKALHLGTIGGAWSLALALAVALIIAGLCVTGCVMWWIRRPPRRWGAPARVEGARLSWGVLAAMILVALLAPVAGASMIVIWIADGIGRKALAA